MAGWDHTFTIDPRDVECFRSCARVLRKTCARHRAEMTYRRWRTLPAGRIEYLIGYNLRSINIGPAVGEFLIEMRAVSATMSSRRARELPLRLAREVAFVNSWTVREQAADGQSSALFESLGDGFQERVIAVMEDFQASFWSWRCGLTSASDFIESQHSLILELGLVFGSATTSASFPTVVDGLTALPVTQRSNLKELGRNRNKVKHREERHESPTFAETYLPDVFTATAILTGMYVDPISADVSELVNQRHGKDPLRPDMFYRSGETRSVRR